MKIACEAELRSRASLQAFQGRALEREKQVSRAMKDEFLFRIDVTAMPKGSLPRYEMKAKRVLVK